MRPKSELNGGEIVDRGTVSYPDCLNFNFKNYHEKLSTTIFQQRFPHKNPFTQKFTIKNAFTIFLSPQVFISTKTVNLYPINSDFLCNSQWAQIMKVRDSDVEFLRTESFEDLKIHHKIVKKL